MGQQQGEEFQATGPEGGVALELGFAQGLQVGGGWAKRGEFRRQEDGAGLGDEQRPQRRDLRERHLRGGGVLGHHPHLPLNRRSPRSYPAPWAMGRGTLTRGPAGVGAPADLAGTRPLVIGAPRVPKSAPSQRRDLQSETPRRWAGGSKGGPFGIRASLRPGDSTA